MENKWLTVCRYQIYNSLSNKNFNLRRCHSNISVLACYAHTYLCTLTNISCMYAVAYLEYGLGWGGGESDCVGFIKKKKQLRLNYNTILKSYIKM